MRTLNCIIIGLMLGLPIAASHETVGKHEYTATGDFDGDGIEDVLIVHKATGQYRVAYGDGASFVWSEVRASGVKHVSDIAVGKLLDLTRDAFAVTSPETNRVQIIAANDRNNPTIPIDLEIDAVGPVSLLAIDVGGPGNTPHHDLVIGSLWNDLPNNGRLNFIRADGSFSPISQTPYGVTELGRRLTLETGGPELGAFMVRGTTTDQLHIIDTSTGASGTPILTLPNLPIGSDYTVGFFNGVGPGHVLTWVPGTNSITSWPISGSAPAYSVGVPFTTSFNANIESLDIQTGSIDPNKLMLIYENGEGAEIYAFDGASTPGLLHGWAPTLSGNGFGAMATLSDGRFFLFSGNDLASAAGLAEVYEDLGGDQFNQTHSSVMPYLHGGSAPANVLLFEFEPFVAADPGLIRAVSSGQWTTSVGISGGNINAISETYVDGTTGLGNPVARTVGTALANENYALANQYRGDVSVYGFTHALGILGLDVSGTPESGTYNRAQQVVLSCNDASATIYYRTDPNSSWITYSGPFFVFTDTDLMYYAADGSTTSAVEMISLHFLDNSGNMDSDGDGVPDYVEIANGLHPVHGPTAEDNGNDYDQDGFSDLEELMLGSDPADPGDTPNGWTPSSTLPRPSLEQQSAFNIQLTPKPYDGFATATTDAANDTLTGAYDLAGNKLAEALVGAPPSKHAPRLWLNGDQTTKQAPSMTLGDFSLLTVFEEHQDDQILLDGLLRLERRDELLGFISGETFIAAPFPKDETHVLGLLRRGKRVTLLRDGAVVASANVTEKLNSGVLSTVPAISELLLFDDKATDDQVTAAQAYLLASTGKLAPIAHLNGIASDSRLVVVQTEPHYHIATANSDTLIGRELVGLVPKPPQTPVNVAYSHGGGDIATETANWLAAAQAAYSAATRETVTADLELADTLAFTLLERKLGELLLARGEVDDAAINLLPQRAGSRNRPTVSEEQIAALSGTVSGIDNGFNPVSLLQQIETELGNSDPDIVQLNNLATGLYEVSSKKHNTPPRQYRLPLDVLRDFISNGELDAPYQTELGLTLSQLTDALDGARTILGALSGRPAISEIMTVTENSFSGNCVTLNDANGDPVSLFNAKNEPYALLQGGGLTLVPGVQLKVSAFTDCTATPCNGEAVLEVFDVDLVGLPIPSGKRAPAKQEESEQANDLIAQQQDSRPTAPLMAANHENGERESSTPSEPEYLTRFEVPGEEGSDRTGTWWEEDTALIGEGGRGLVTYTMNPDYGDRFRLEVALAGEQDERESYTLRLWVDDVYMGRHTVEASYREEGLVHVHTPYLPAGPHQIRILWDDLPGSEPLAIVALRLQERLGEDNDANGLKDWLDSWLASNHYADRAPMTSPISPVTLEGAAAHVETMRINDGISAEQGLQGGWFAHLPLHEQEATRVRIRYQNGAWIEEGFIEWTPTNVLTAEEITLRQGDALRLTAHHGKVEGRYQIRTDGMVLRERAANPTVHRFEHVGEFQIEAAHYAPDGTIRKGSMRVKVVGNELSDASVWTGNTRKWDLHGLDDQIVLEYDEDLELLERAYLPRGGRRIELSTRVPETRHVVARLGEGGRLIDAARIDGFEVFTAAQTYIRVAEQHEDGSEAIAAGVVASPVPKDAELRLSVIVGGVTFDDGNLRKTLMSQDFDALGQAEVRFNRSAGAKTAVCHVTEAYQRYVFIGTVKQLREEPNR